MAPPGPPEIINPGTPAPAAFGSNTSVISAAKGKVVVKVRI